MKKFVRYEVQPGAPIRIITYHFCNHPKIWRHWHEYLEIIYLVRGSVALKLDERIYNARSGDILVFNSFEVHESVNLSAENEYYVFVVPPEYFLAAQSDQAVQFNCIIRNDADCSRSIKNAAALIDAPDNGSQYLLNAEILRFLYAATKNHSRMSKVTQLQKTETRYIIEDIQKRISRCYAEPLNISILASAFCVSVSYLQHSFKAQTGYSIIDYLNRTRIDNAARLLCETDLHISEIAEKVGFTDYNYFSRVFGKYKNMTPSKYRINGIPDSFIISPDNLTGEINRN